MFRFYLKPKSRWSGLSFIIILVILIVADRFLTEAPSEIVPPLEVPAPSREKDFVTHADLKLEASLATLPTSTISKKELQKTPPENYYSIEKIIDGDTIKIKINNQLETIRLIGLNTPETVDPRKPAECFGQEASRLAKFLLSDKKIYLEFDPSQGERDRYGRLLAYVFRSDGLFYNYYLIEQGYGYEYTYQREYKYQAQFKKAEQKAKEEKRGLWADRVCQ